MTSVRAGGWGLELLAYFWGILGRKAAAPPEHCWSWVLAWVHRNHSSGKDQSWLACAALSSVSWLEHPPVSFHSDGNNYEDYLSLVTFRWQTFRAQNFLCNILGISPTTCCSMVMSVVIHLFSKEEHIDMGKSSIQNQHSFG